MPGHTDRPLQTPTGVYGELRRRAGISLREMEERTGINRGTLSRWERGTFLLNLEQTHKVLLILEEGLAAGDGAQR